LPLSAFPRGLRVFFLSGAPQQRQINRLVCCECAERHSQPQAANVRNRNRVKLAL
jgi:hypothetical protein